MLNFYYKIWVSLFIRIRTAQNENHNLALILSLIVITISNIINYFFITYMLLIFLHTNINFITLFNFKNKFISIFIVLLIFMIPNYLLLIFDRKHQILMDKYSENINKKLGLYYFALSCSTILIFLVLMILFPTYFGLKSSH
jgi:hypothetical protein